MWSALLIIVGSIVTATGAVRGAMYLRERYGIHPADSYDVEGLLKRRGLWELFRSGGLQCVICRSPVTFANLGTIAEDESTGDIDLICRKPVCLSRYIAEVEERALDRTADPI